MQPNAIFGGLAALASITSAFAIESRQTPTGGCAKGVHVIAAGGSNSLDEYSYGLLGTLAQSIVAAIPGSDTVSLPYNKTDVKPQVLDPAAIPTGIQTAGTYVEQYHAACPDTKIAILGYSSGAVITMSALCGGPISQALAGNTIIANVAYGDDTRVAGQPYDLGTCTGNGKRPRANPEACGAYIPLTRSYCDTNDPQCCSGPKQDYEIHFVYPMKYDKTATQFVVDQFNKLGSGISNSSSSSSVMSSTVTASSTGFVGFGNSTTTMTGTASSAMTTTMTSSMGTTTTMMMTTGTSSVVSAASSGASSVVPDVSSLASAAGSAATSLTPANPNGQAILLPSTALFNAACLGGLVLLGAALL